MSRLLPSPTAVDLHVCTTDAAAPYPFLVRVRRSNDTSIGFFQSLGFAEVRDVQALNEVEKRVGWVPSGDGSDGEEAFLSVEEMER
jgi:hypothetical protein